MSAGMPYTLHTMDALLANFVGSLRPARPAALLCVMWVNGLLATSRFKVPKSAKNGKVKRWFNQAFQENLGHLSERTVRNQAERTTSKQ